MLSEALTLPGADGMPAVECGGPQRVTHINDERVHSLAHLAQRVVALTTPAEGAAVRVELPACMHACTEEPCLVG